MLPIDRPAARRQKGYLFVLKRLSHVCLGATDLEATIAFYANLLGCKVAHEFRDDTGERYGVFLATNSGTFLEFFHDTTVTAASGRFRHLCFEVADIASMAEKARAQGYDAEVHRGRSDRVLQFFIEDIDGNVIEFQQHDRHSALLPFLEATADSGER